MEIDKEKLDILVENVMVIGKYAAYLACDLEDLQGNLGVIQTAVDNLQDILTELMLTPEPVRASSHPTLLSPGPAQGQDQEKEGSQGKEPRQ